MSDLNGRVWLIGVRGAPGGAANPMDWEQFGKLFYKGGGNGRAIFGGGICGGCE